MASRKRSLSNDADISVLHKEWDEALCPICMDHPHNTVLILCSSHDNGCRSYICDTSYRHSNCLDRFKKLVSDNNSSSSPLPRDHDNLIETSDSNLIEVNGNQDPIDTVAYIELAGGPGENSQGIHETGDPENITDSRSSLKCPLCRGSVLGWEVVEDARNYLNMKPRSCSQELCSFSGNYRELRRHARRAHPTARPSDIDPVRERAWRHLENQREYGDIVSAIRSAMPNAVVFGDYAIENADRLGGERDRGPGEGSHGGPWWTTFFLFQMIGSMDPAAERRGGRSRVPTRHRRRLLWGENLLGLQDDEEREPFDLNILSDTGEDPSPNPRRRRRLTRYRSDEDHS